MESSVLTLRTLSELHRLCGLPAPLHPLISLVDYGRVNYQTDGDRLRWVQDFYAIGFKYNLAGLRYGQQAYDFDGGVATFVAPRQVIELEIDHAPAIKPSGRLLLLHPDFLWNTQLATTIRRYEFFGYAVNEALFLSTKEEGILLDILTNIERECGENYDDFSQDIIVSQLETLLNYCERFYRRQFLTRRKSNDQLLHRLEAALDRHFAPGTDDGDGARRLPTAQQLAAELNISPNYLGSLLKNLTGQTTQQHIHHRLIERAKERLSTTALTVGEIAYELGFEHPSSFSTLFRGKVGMTPVRFRKAYQRN